MAKVNRFEELDVWNNSRTLSKIIYENFGELKDYGFKDQICRASISISNNIAEGFERMSKKELKYFLYISKGSSGEVRNLLYLALDLGYINQETFEDIYDKVVIISKQLYTFIKSL